MERNGRRSRRLSAALKAFESPRQETVLVADLLDALGDRGLGAAMLLLALPNLVPLPPGASTLFGLPLMLVAAQLALGRTAVWLPDVVRRRALPAAVVSGMTKATRPYLRRAERLLRPRMRWLLAPLPARLTGVGCFVLAVLIALPIPLANFLSGLSIAAFALGLLRHDGVAVLLGWLLALVSFAATALVSGAVWIAAKGILHWLDATPLSP